MDPSVAIGVGVLWLLFNIFGRKKNRPQPPHPAGLPASTGADATQREGARLQDLLGEVEGRPQRIEVDTDDQVEAVIARRRAAAEAHVRPPGRSDHVAFDARIRQEPADVARTQAVSMQRLREAIVWREILGPPVSLRDPER